MRLIRLNNYKFLWEIEIYIFHEPKNGAKNDTTLRYERSNFSYGLEQRPGFI